MFQTGKKYSMFVNSDYTPTFQLCLSNNLCLHYKMSENESLVFKNFKKKNLMTLNFNTR